MRRIALLFFLFAAGELVFPHIANAQFFPTKPIRIVCPFPPGAGGNIAAAEVAKEIVARLNAEASKGASSKDFRERMEPLGFEILTGTPERMAELIKHDITRWTPVVKASGARAD